MGFTYAVRQICSISRTRFLEISLMSSTGTIPAQDRDAKRKWASNASQGLLGNLGGLGGGMTGIAGSLATNALGKFFG